MAVVWSRSRFGAPRALVENPDDPRFLVRPIPSQSQFRRAAAVAFALLIVFPSFLILTAGDARADSTPVIMTATLPSARQSTSAVWAGTDAYIFGGNDASNPSLDQIVRYSPATNTVTTMTATLPTVRMYTSAVWDGTNAYVFGGYNANDGSQLNQIVRYNPALNSATSMVATLPTGRYATSAVWDGSNAYIFGGVGGGGVWNQIVRYNPATDTTTTMTATLPTGTQYASAVWAGTSAYIFGGKNQYGGRLNSVVRYNPSTDTITQMVAAFPAASDGATGRFATNAIWDGGNAYVFGGQIRSNINEIVRYNPTADSFTVMSATLPSIRSSSSAAWDGTNAYVFGGTDGASTLNQIVSYTPGSGHVDPKLPDAPMGLSAIPANFQISLQWSAGYDGGSAITNYRVSRVDGPQGSSNLLTTGGCANLSNVLSCTDSSLTNDQLYQYTVSAVNVVGPGPPSNSVSMTPPSGNHVDPNLAPNSPSPANGATNVASTTNLGWARSNQNAGLTATYLASLDVASTTSSTIRCSSSTALTCPNSNLGGLAPSTTYRWFVTEYDGQAAGNNGPSWTFTTSADVPPQPTVPDPPVGLFATAGNSQVTLRWSPGYDGGSAITNYRVLRADGSGVANPLTSGGCANLSTQLSCTDSGLTNGQLYQYTVKAVNAIGPGSPSNQVSATPMGAATAPSAPQNLQATAGNSLNYLGWQAPASDGGSAIAHYQVLRGTSSANRQPVATGTCANLGAVLSCTDTGLTNGQSYDYIVRAVNGVGPGAGSNSAPATPTAAVTPADLVIKGITFNPASPAAGQAYAATCTFSNGGGTAASGFDIIITIDGATSQTKTYGTLRPAGQDAATLNFLGTTQGSHKAICEVNHNGAAKEDATKRSDDSWPQSFTVGPPAATVPGAPILQAPTPGDARVSLVWSAPSSDGGSPITNYRVFRATTSGTTNPNLVTNGACANLGNILTCTDNSGLTNGQTYYYVVRAVNRIDQGDPSIEGTTAPTSARSGTGYFFIHGICTTGEGYWTDDGAPGHAIWSDLTAGSASAYWAPTYAPSNPDSMVQQLDEELRAFLDGTASKYLISHPGYDQKALPHQDGPLARVVLIGHSNGGLMARALLNRETNTDYGTFIKRVITIDSPDLGAGEAYKFAAQTHTGNCPDDWAEYNVAFLAHDAVKHGLAGTGWISRLAPVPTNEPRLIRFIFGTCDGLVGLVRYTSGSCASGDGAVSGDDKASDGAILLAYASEDNAFYSPSGGSSGGSTSVTSEVNTCKQMHIGSTGLVGIGIRKGNWRQYQHWNDGDPFYYIYYHNWGTDFFADYLAATARTGLLGFYTQQDTMDCELANNLPSNSLGAVLSIVGPDEHFGPNHVPTTSVAFNKDVRADVLDAKNGNGVAFKVGSNSRPGKVVVVYSEPKAWGTARADQVGVWFDGTRLTPVGTLPELTADMSATSSPKYFIQQTSPNYEFLIWVPHFSNHTIELAGIPDLGQAFITPMGIMAMVLGSLLLASGAYGIGRRRGRSKGMLAMAALPESPAPVIEIEAESQAIANQASATVDESVTADERLSSLVGVARPPRKGPRRGRRNSAPLAAEHVNEDEIPAAAGAEAIDAQQVAESTAWADLGPLPDETQHSSEWGDLGPLPAAFQDGSAAGIVHAVKATRRKGTKRKKPVAEIVAASQEPARESDEANPSVRSPPQRAKKPRRNSARPKPGAEDDSPASND